MGFVGVLRRMVGDESAGIERAEYPEDMTTPDEHPAFGFPLPEGIVYRGPAKLPDAESRRRALARYPHTYIPAKIADVDEAIAHMERASGCISIGRAPRRSDYRGRGKWS